MEKKNQLQGNDKTYYTKKSQSGYSILIKKENVELINEI